MMTKRYTSQGYYAPSYYEVVCPKCELDAHIHLKKGYLICENCNHQETVVNKVYYDLSLNVYCPDCGIRNELRKTGLIIKPKEMVAMECVNCKAIYSYKASITSYYQRLKRNDGLKTDPFLGYPLWLQTESCGKLFWAYNHEHLELIRTYVTAFLRERQPNSYLMTMEAKLPTFIKTAKNRERILASIEKMKNKK